MHGSTELTERTDRADRDLWVDWHEALRELPGDPFSVEIRHFGRATALLSHGIPSSHYNRVLGLTERDHRHVPEIARFYRERFTPYRIDLNPFFAGGGSEGTGLLAELSALAFCVSDFQMNLYTALPAEVSVRPPGVTVWEVGADDFDLFAQLYESAYHHGYNIPSGIIEFRIASLKARYGRPGWRFYIASVDGVPAAGGMLHFRDGVCTLAGGATIHTMRGRGCQGALIARRLTDAAELGCELAVSRCAVGSTSQRNLERVGLRIAYTKFIWEQPPVRPWGPGPMRSARASVPTPVPLGAG